jgi:hypothetical protein
MAGSILKPVLRLAADALKIRQIRLAHGLGEDLSGWSL